MEYDLTNLIILFLFGNFAGLINVMAGGGSTLTLPFLIFMGLDAASANGTNRIGILALTSSAIMSFKKEDHSDFVLSTKLSLLTIPGAIIGSLYAIEISDSTFKTILAFVMIGVILTMIIPKSKQVELKETVEKLPVIAYPVMLAVGFYGGFIQAGIGFILMWVMHNLLHLNLIKVNMHKVFIVFFYTIPTLFIFFITDNIYWIPGIVLALGTSIGAWWSAKLSIHKGEKIVKAMLIVAILLMSMKLLELF